MTLCRYDIFPLIFCNLCSPRLTDKNSFKRETKTARYNMIECAIIKEDTKIYKY